MDFILDQLSQGPDSHRLFLLVGTLLIAGFGLFPAPLDLLLAAAGVLIGKQRLPYLPTASLSLVTILTCDTVSFELGKRFGKALLQNSAFQNSTFGKRFGSGRIAALRERLLQSEVRIARSLRFNLVLKPYFIFFSSALGLSRDTFYRIHFTITAVYIPVLLGGMALLSERVPLKDWQILAVVGGIWVATLVLPGRKADTN